MFAVCIKVIKQNLLSIILTGGDTCAERNEYLSNIHNLQTM